MKIAALGDSITFGFPFSPRESWVHLTGLALQTVIYNRGVCGNTTGEMLMRLDAVLRLEPDVIVVTGGSNDAICGIAPKEVSENFALMGKQLCANGIQYVIGMPPPCNSPQEEALLGRYRALLRDYARKENIPIIDFEAALLAEGRLPLPPTLLVDGWHPSETGYRVLAAAAIPVLTQLMRAKAGGL